MLRLYPVILLLFLSVQLEAQSVGLVLSGGGARGITHLGVIKALEENDIPIDFIAGTSMGAIVGSMYSLAYTPDEVIELLKSDDFKRWSSGEMDPNYIYYYRNLDPKPGIYDIHFRLHKKDSFKIKTRFLPTNLISPIQMNYAFLELFSQGTASSGGDFDKLFVPFRCVASDVYVKEAVVLSSGQLGDAVRASMTFPFMFKPITIDGRLLFDGGIYNNFPIDVMQEVYNPDFVVGSVVSQNPPKPNDDDLIQQLSNMIMSKTDYSFNEINGVLFDFDLENINTFDFSQVDELVQLGYDSTMAHIDEIKSKIKRRVKQEVLNEKRLEFKSKLPPLKFQNVVVEGVDSLKKKYIHDTFDSRDSLLCLSDVKKKYFQLVSDDKISEVRPHAIYDTVSGLFDLNLKVRSQDKLKLSIGGNVSSSTSNEAYFGLTYQSLKEYAQVSYADIQFGTMYNALGVGTRFDVTGDKNFYMKLAAVFHKFDYFETNQLFFNVSNFNESAQYELYTKLSIGMPLSHKGRLVFGLGYGNLYDNYRQPDTQIYKSVFNLGKAYLDIKSFSQNTLLYPTEGKNHSISLQLFGGEERFYYTSNLSQNRKTLDMWGQLSAKYDYYFKINNRFVLGTQADLVLSTRDFLSNYTVTLNQAPTFRPTIHSQTVFKPTFSANQYAAVGIKPIFKINESLHWRNEIYLFVPYRNILSTTNSQAVYSSTFPGVDMILETALVFEFKTAKASVFYNYYTSTVNSPSNFGVNIGLLLFNNKFMY